MIPCSSLSSLPNSSPSIFPLKITGNKLQCNGPCAGQGCLSFAEENEDREDEDIHKLLFLIEPLSVNELLEHLFSVKQK